MDIFSSNTTLQIGTNSESSENAAYWSGAWRIVKITTVVFSVLGLLGNFLSYKTADFMPKSNSSVLMKYLAVWDSVSVCLSGIIPGSIDLAGFYFRMTGEVSEMFRNLEFFELP